MSAKWEKKGTNDGELTFEIDLPKIQEGLDQAFQRVRKNLTVPGFRKGKVSRTVFKRMYGDAALYEDALNILLPDAYEAAVKESGIDPVDQPKIDVESMDEDKPWVIKANVTVNLANTRALKCLSKTLKYLTTTLTLNWKSAVNNKPNSWLKTTRQLKMVIPL